MENRNYRTSLQFKHRIELVKKGPGGPWPGMDEWETIAKPWAAIKTMKGSEHNIAALAGNTGKSRFIIRYMKGITADLKIRYKGELYDIESITNDNEDNRTITMIAETNLNEEV